MESAAITVDMGNMLTWDELKRGAANIKYEELRHELKTRIDATLLESLMIHLSFKPLKTDKGRGMIKLKLTGVNSDGNTESIFLYKSPISIEPADPQSWSPTRVAVALAREMFELRRVADRPSAIALSLGFGTDEVKKCFSEITTYGVGLADVQAACHLATEEPKTANLRISEMLAVCYARDIVGASKGTTGDSWMDQLLRSAMARRLLTVTEMEKILSTQDFVEKSSAVTAAALRRGARALVLPEETRKLMGTAKDKILAMTRMRMGEQEAQHSIRVAKIVPKAGLGESGQTIAKMLISGGHVAIVGGKIVGVKPSELYDLEAMGPKIPMLLEIV